MSSKEIKITAVNTGKTVDISPMPAQKKTTLRKEGERHGKKHGPKQEEPEDDAALERIPVKPSVPNKKEPTTILRSEEERTVERPIIPVEPLEIDESGDFAAMLFESEKDQQKNVFAKLGDKITGRIIQMSGDNIFIVLGPKAEASIPLAEFLDADGNPKVKVGDTISGFVVSTYGGVHLSNQVSQKGLDDSMLLDAQAKGVPVEGKVTGVNKGGFEVTIAGKRAFCPVGQIDDRFVEDTNSFVGRVLNFLVERVEEGGRNIVVSRRALLTREKKEKAKDTLKTLEVGQTVDAVITRVTDFGAFADIGGIEGLIPRSEISHGHIDRVSDEISSNDRVSVQVLNVEKNEAEPSKSKVSLSIKKTKQDPFSLYGDRIKEGTTLEGRVVRLESFGAFVELFPGVDGLIHISELSEKKVAHPKEVLNINQPVTVRVLSVDPKEKRIGLSLREDIEKKKKDDKGSGAKVDRGQKVQGVVSRIERYGVFLELENGLNALLPVSECGLAPHADLARSFKLGQSLSVMVIDIDDKNRIRVSLIALEKMEERDSYLQFQTKENKSSSFGTFADLLKKNK